MTDNDPDENDKYLAMCADILLMLDKLVQIAKDSKCLDVIPVFTGYQKRITGATLFLSFADLGQPVSATEIGQVRKYVRYIYDWLNRTHEESYGKKFSDINTTEAA